MCSYSARYSAESPRIAVLSRSSGAAWLAALESQLAVVLAVLEAGKGLERAAKLVRLSLGQ